LDTDITNVTVVQICHANEEGRVVSHPAPSAQDPRIQVDSAQRCFKKATRKSASAQIAAARPDEWAQRQRSAIVSGDARI
jgi:predicted nucleic acid-binding Zn ribbon protein